MYVVAGDCIFGSAFRLKVLAKSTAVIVLPVLYLYVFVRVKV
jgi:hypothetical protein